MSAVPPRGRLRLLLLLTALPLAMAALAFFAMPPLYTLWCKLTSTTIRPNNQSETAAEVATGRFVEVFFEAKIYDGLPVEFSSDQPSVTVEVGREGMVTYRLRNRSDRTLNIRPIHQVSPLQAADEFSMRICFCFTDQVLPPGESREFPVVFRLKPNLDPRLTIATVCYSLFAIDPKAPRSEAQIRIQRQIEGAGGVVSPNFKIMSESELQKLRAEEERK